MLVERPDRVGNRVMRPSERLDSSANRGIVHDDPLEWLPAGREAPCDCGPQRTRSRHNEIADLTDPVFTMSEVPRRRPTSEEIAPRNTFGDAPESPREGDRRLAGHPRSARE